MVFNAFPDGQPTVSRQSTITYKLQQKVLLVRRFDLTMFFMFIAKREQRAFTFFGGAVAATVAAVKLICKQAGGDANAKSL